MQHQYNEMTSPRMPRACKTRRGTGQSQNARQTRRTRVATQPEMLQQQQNAMLAAPTQIPDYSLYTMPDQTNLQPNNTPHPDMQLPRTTATYTATAMNEQTISHRYFTRRVVHNSTICSASNIERFWHPQLTARPPLFHGGQQIPTPATHSKPQTKEVSTQTDVAISDKELKLLKALRDEKVDISKFYSIIEKSDYIVSFDQNESKEESEEENKETDTAPSNEIVNYNAAQHVMTMAYIIELQRRLATSMSSAKSLPAIEGNPASQTDVMTCPAPITMEESLLSPGFLQNDQQDGIVNEPFIVEQLPTQEIICDNIQTTRNPVNTRQAQPQVTPPPGFPIPNIMNQCMYNNQMRYGPPNRHGYNVRGPHSRQHPNNNNVNFFQTTAFFGQYYVEEIQQQRPRGWCPNPNMFPTRPPWL